MKYKPFTLKKSWKIPSKVIKGMNKKKFLKGNVIFDTICYSKAMPIYIKIVYDFDTNEFILVHNAEETKTFVEAFCSIKDLKKRIKYLVKSNDFYI
jgi:hypothetical protein